MGAGAAGGAGALWDLGFRVRGSGAQAAAWGADRALTAQQAEEAPHDGAAGVQGCARVARVSAQPAQGSSQRVGDLLSDRSP